MISVERPDWFKDAACKGLDIKLFFPERHQPHHLKEARKICAACPVQQECRTYAIDLHEIFETFGVWGGTTHKDRCEELRSNYRVAARGAYPMSVLG